MRDGSRKNEIKRIEKDARTYIQLHGRWSKLNGRKEGKEKMKWRRGTKEATRVIGETGIKYPFLFSFLRKKR